MIEQRKESRTARPLKVKYKSATVDDFVQQQGTDVSRTGVFIKTKSPLEAGELLKLELQLADASSVIAGVGRVAWRRASSTDASRPAGMGIKFIKLEPASQAIVERIVSERGEPASRFDQSEGAELARPSFEPPPPSMTAPRAPTPMPSMPAAKPAAPPAPKPALPPAPAPAPFAAKPVEAAPRSPLAASIPFGSAVAGAAKPATASARIGPTKANIPSGLFAQTPIAKKEPPPEEEARTSFFPPPPAPVQPPSTSGRTTGSTSAATQVPRSSSGSVSSPLNRASATSRASLASGPKGVFGGPAVPSPLASSASGRLQPAKEVSGLSSGALFSSRDDEVATTAPVGRASRRPSSTPLPTDDKPTTRPPPMEAPPPAALPAAPRAPEDGMFATLEPLGSDGEGSGSFAAIPPTRSSRPSGRATVPSTEAEVDALFDDLAGNEPAAFEPPFNDEAPTGDMERPPASAAPSAATNTDHSVRASFAPGSTHPSGRPDLDELLGSDSEEDFGEADLVGSASIKPMLSDEAEAEAEHIPRLHASQHPGAAPRAESASGAGKGKLIAIVLVALIAIAAAAFFLMKPAPTAQAPAPTPPAEAPAPAATTPEPSVAAPSAEPAAKAPIRADAPTARVNVTALPRGAEVKVNGEAKGLTPTNIDLPIGHAVTVSVTAQGHVTLSKDVTASEGMEPLRFKLEPLPYELVVVSNPPDAEITFGSKTGSSAAPIALGHLTGDAEVSIAKTGYRKLTRPVRLDEFVERDGVMRAEIQVTLSPMPGTVVPRAEPAPAPAPAPSAAPPRRGSQRRGGRARAPAEAVPAPPEPEAAPQAKEPEPGDELEAKPKPAEKEPDFGDDIEPSKPQQKVPPPPPPLPDLPE